MKLTNDMRDQIGDVLKENKRLREAIERTLSGEAGYWPDVLRAALARYDAQALPDEQEWVKHKPTCAWVLYERQARCDCSQSAAPAQPQPAPQKP